jgi:hypothetical protein
MFNAPEWVRGYGPSIDRNPSPCLYCCAFCVALSRRERAQQQAALSNSRYTAAIASISSRKFGLASPRRMHSVLPGGCLPK